MRKILVVVDMQNDFIDGALGTEEALSIVGNVIKKVDSYRREDVFATRDTHGEDYLETQEGKRLPVMHCVRGTDGWRIRKEISERIDERNVFDKPTFGSVELAKQIEKIAGSEEGGIEIEICGLCTDICVISNALLLKAFLPEVRISLDPRCCAGVTPEKHAAAIEAMRSCQIEVIDLFGNRTGAV